MLSFTFKCSISVTNHVVWKISFFCHYCYLYVLKIILEGETRKITNITPDVKRQLIKLMFYQKASE